MALRSELLLVQAWVNGSIAGSSVKVRVTDFKEVEDLDAAMTEVTGSANINGFNQWVLEDADPFPTRFFFR